MKRISRLKGRVWKFGDNVDTDVIISGKYLNLTMDEMKNHVLEAVSKNFSKNVKPGEMIVAGRNYGCGSSRETAPAALKALGIGAIVAESFARIFYRNSIAIGLPAIPCPGIAKIFKNGDEVDIDMKKSLIMNVTSKESLKFQPFPVEMMRVLEDGGIEHLLKQMVFKGQKRSGKKKVSKG